MKYFIFLFLIFLTPSCCTYAKKHCDECKPLPEIKIVTPSFDKCIYPSTIIWEESFLETDDKNEQLRKISKKIAKIEEKLLIWSEYKLCIDSILEEYKKRYEELK
jgi:hypothetical protein